MKDIHKVAQSNLFYKTISNTSSLFLLFIIIIIAITIIYIREFNITQNILANSGTGLGNTIEQFGTAMPVITDANPDTNQNPNQNPNPNPTVNPNDMPDFTFLNAQSKPTAKNAKNDANAKNAANAVNVDIVDTITNNNIMQSLQDLQKGLQRFSNLDAPITMNDNGQKCLEWGQYQNSKYIANANNCILVDSNNVNTNNNIRKCLGATGLSTCNNLYSDGYIEKMNNIDFQPLVSKAQSEIMFNIVKNKLDIANKTKELDTIINDLITKRNLEIQQLYFINYNTNNLQDKEHNVETINKELTDKQLNVNINQASFSQFLAANNSNEKINSTYYKITIGLIITLIIVGILNVMFSNIL